MSTSRLSDIAGGDHALGVPSPAPSGPPGYAVNPAIPLTSYGQSWWFVQPWPNVANATLNVGGLGPLPLKTTKGAAVTGGECAFGCILMTIGSPASALIVH